MVSYKEDLLPSSSVRLGTRLHTHTLQASTQHSGGVGHLDQPAPVQQEWGTAAGAQISEQMRKEWTAKATDSPKELWLFLQSLPAVSSNSHNTQQPCFGLQSQVWALCLPSENTLKPGVLAASGATGGPRWSFLQGLVPPPSPSLQG